MPTAISAARSDAPVTTAAAPAGDTTLYFAIALGLTWIALLPPSLAALGLLPGEPAEYMAGAPLAVFAPTIAAIVAARREGGWAAVRTMLRGLGATPAFDPRRVGVGWLVLAIILPGLVYAAARAVYGLAGGDDLPWLYLPSEPEHFAAILLVPICEEIGWRGFALPRLITRHGALRASAILGLLWALWHVPMFVSQGMSAPETGAALAMIAIGNLVYTWMFRRAGGSLLVAWLLHLGGHLDNPTRASEPAALYLLAAGFVVLALALLALDRRAFEGKTIAAPPRS